MNKFQGITVLFILSFLFLKCTSAPMHGYLYNYSKHHVFPLASGSSQLQSNAILISGKSCSIGSSIILALFYYGGGGSIEEAAQSGGITKIAVIDRESISLIYGIFYQECVVVWGE